MYDDLIENRDRNEEWTKNRESNEKLMRGNEDPIERNSEWELGDQDYWPSPDFKKAQSSLCLISAFTAEIFSVRVLGVELWDFFG